jgi:acetyl-CoA C-acetyltransferase
MGSTFGEGTTGGNIARAIALRAGLPVTTAGLSINRFCSSGLQSIALAAQRIMTEGAQVIVAGGWKAFPACRTRSTRICGPIPGSSSTSRRCIGRCCRPPKPWPSATTSPRRRRTNTVCAASCARPRRRPPASSSDEIVPMTTVMGVVDKDDQRHRTREVTIDRDEGIRPTPRSRPCEDPAGAAGRRHHGGQCQPILGWQQRLRAHGCQARRTTWPSAAGHFSRLRRRRLRTR